MAEELRVYLDTFSAAFSPDGSLLAIPGKKSAVVLNLDGVPIDYPLEGLTVSQIAFRPNSSEIAVPVPSKNSIRRLVPGGVVEYLSVSRPFKTAYSHDGKLLASGNSLGKIEIWNVQKDEARSISTADLAREPVCSLSFSADGKFLYATVTSGACYLIDIEDKSECELKCERMGDMECYTVAAHPTRPEVAVFAGTGRQLWLRDNATGNWHLAGDNTVGESIRHLYFQGDKLVAMGANGIQVYTLSENKLNVYRHWKRSSEKCRVLAGCLREQELFVAYLLLE